MLGKRHDVGQRVAEVSDEIPDLGGIGASAGEQTRARGRADGLLAIRAVEGDALFRDAVEVRALHVVRTISTELGAQVVNGDEEDIGPISGVGETDEQPTEERSEAEFHG